MAGKEIKKILNDLISESDKKKPIRNLNRLSSLNIPVESCGDDMFAVDLNEIVVFDGIEIIISRLLDQVRESCFFGQSDMSVAVNVEKEICQPLYDYGIHKISFYSPIENLEDLPLLYNKLVIHLRYIFNALQSPGISKGFFKNDPDENNVSSLLFPFNREVDGDQTGLHYLVEKVVGLHFLRITVEELDHSRLNFRRINHRVISNIELIDDLLNIRHDAATIYSSVVSHCRDNKLTYKDTGLQLSELLNFLKKAGYANLKEFTVNWPRSIVSGLLLGEEHNWYGSLSRILLILSDSTVHELLKSGKTIEINYVGTKAYLSLTQRFRNLQVDLHEKVKVSNLNEYLVKMTQLHQATETMEQFNKLHLLFIHHFTSETLAVLGAFDKLGICSVDSLWVKYAGSIPAKYLDTIMGLPSMVYKFYGLQLLDDNQHKTRFCLSDRYSPIDAFSNLQQEFINGEYEFYPAMQFVAMHLFLNAVVDVDPDVKIVIAEDGGYLAPLINRLSLEKLNVREVFKQYAYHNDKVKNEEMLLAFGDWIKHCYAGSVEHTRNGYDALADVETEFSKLAFPACSLAVSNFKVNDESIEVAYSCLNAMENIMNGQGFVMNNRTALVLGSMGAIGVQAMKILSHRIGVRKLAGIDSKVDGSEGYAWEQVGGSQNLSSEMKYSVDMIFGVIGKSILKVAFFEDLLFHTQKRHIFMASGSTKRFEFIDFLDWIALLLSEKTPSIKGVPVEVASFSLEDSQTSASLGTIIRFNMKMAEGDKLVNFYLLSNLMPVNFQYYGVPTETMDVVMTEFVSLVNVVSQSKEKDLPARLLALDHDIDLNGNFL